MDPFGINWWTHPVYINTAMGCTLIDASATKTASSAPQTEKREIETTEKELTFYELVKGMAERAGYDPATILARDTVNYFNISYKKPTKWFVRFFANSRRQTVSTLVSTDRCRELLPSFEVEDAPSSFGVSRIYVQSIEQVPNLEPVIIESLKQLGPTE